MTYVSYFRLSFAQQAGLVFYIFFTNKGLLGLGKGLNFRLMKTADLVQKIVSDNAKITKLTRALELHLQFLASLPPGWLAHTTGDVGLLNDAYLASRDAGVEIPGKQKD